MYKLICRDNLKRILKRAAYLLQSETEESECESSITDSRVNLVDEERRLLKEQLELKQRLLEELEKKQEIRKAELDLKQAELEARLKSLEAERDFYNWQKEVMTRKKDKKKLLIEKVKKRMEKQTAPSESTVDETKDLSKSQIKQKPQRQPSKSKPAAAQLKQLPTECQTADSLSTDSTQNEPYEMLSHEAQLLQKEMQNLELMLSQSLKTKRIFRPVKSKPYSRQSQAKPSFDLNSLHFCCEEYAWRELTVDSFDQLAKEFADYLN